MEDFNSIVSDLINHLRLTYEVDGTIYWYEGTPQLLLKMVSFLAPSKNNDSKE